MGVKAAVGRTSNLDGDTDGGAERPDRKAAGD
jgi:hypothetical protein